MAPQAQERIAVSVIEAGAMLSLGRDVIFRLCASGEIPSFKCGARRLISVAGLRAYVERQTAEPTEANE